MSNDTDPSLHLTQQMRDKLRVRGRTLAQVVSRAGRRLPRPARAAAARLVATEGLAQNPRLALTLDADAMAADRRLIEGYLADIDPSEARKSWLLGVLASIAINLLALFALLIAVLMWRGYL